MCTGEWDSEDGDRGRRGARTMIPWGRCGDVGGWCGACMRVRVHDVLGEGGPSCGDRR